MSLAVSPQQQAHWDTLRASKLIATTTGKSTPHAVSNNLQPSCVRPSPTPLDRHLLEAAAMAREHVGILSSIPSTEALSFHSCFGRDSQIQQPSSNSSIASQNQNSNSPKSVRGFCNWLIPGHLMIGQYPGQNPLNDGPNANEVQCHIQCLTKTAKVSVFCSLQSETPAQDHDAAWLVEHKESRKNENGNSNNNNSFLEGGACYLKPEYRSQLPRPFRQYAPLVRHYSADLHNTTTAASQQTPAFLHVPLVDLSIPESQEPLQELLLQLLQHLAASRVVYVHCWGGRGRAGLVGACLLALLYPQMSPDLILEWVQVAYATRQGHANLAPQYAQSPQTPDQRAFVRRFVQEHQLLWQQQQPQQQA